MISAILFTVMSMSLDWKLKHLDTYSAYTTIRLWHELHCEKKIAHDFSDMISPPDEKEEFYVGAVLHNEIRAIATCKKEDKFDTFNIRRIACGPEKFDAAVALINLLHSSKSSVEPSLKNQPRWFLEHMYVVEEKEKVKIKEKEDKKQ